MEGYVDSSLPLLPAVMNRDGRLEVSLTKAVALERDHGRGVRIRGQIVGVVPNHSGKISYRIRRKDVLIGTHAHGFEVVAVLPLTGGLLELLIGHQKAWEFVAHADANPVALGEVALVTGGEVSGGAGVGEVLHDRRVQVPIGVVAIGTHGHAVPAPAVLRLCGSAACVEAAAGKVQLPVQAGARVSRTALSSTMPPIFLPYSAGMPAVKTLIGGERLAIVIGFTGQFNPALEAASGRIGDPEA